MACPSHSLMFFVSQSALAAGKYTIKLKIKKYNPNEHALRLKYKCSVFFLRSTQTNKL